jgi:hypothetical protein
VEQFLRTSTSSPALQNAWTSKLENIQRRKERVEIADIICLLQLVLESLELAFVCIDALDELERSVRQELLSRFRNLKLVIYGYFSPQGLIFVKRSTACWEFPSHNMKLLSQLMRVILNYILSTKSNITQTGRL